MPIFSVQLGAFEVIAECRAELEPHARFFLRTLSMPGVQLRDGLEISAGWSTLFARSDSADERRLSLCEPDFERDPLRGRRADVSFTLGLIATQRGIAQDVGAAFVPSTYRQRLAVSPRGALKERRVTLFRTGKARFENDSGWLVMPEGAKGGKGEHEIIHAYELMKVRPALVQALALPPEYVAVFDGDTLDAVGRPDS